MSETRRIAALFDRVAPRYDLLNRLMSLGQDRAWRARLVASLGERGRGRVLDVGCGTGDVTLALAAHGAQPVGLDPSAEMLRRARAKAPHLAWVQGDALRLPFKERCFDGATSAFVLRNLPDRKASFAEQARVLRAGGVAAHLELVRPQRGPARVLHAAYVRVAVPALGLLSSNRHAYRYLARTVMLVPQPESFAAELGEAGLPAARISRMAGGGVAVVAARKPE
jgi:demethylmenaquinone methyltransferase/2-methoxy-6-polyprenyl-1,4-benzoquinol methylase